MILTDENATCLRTDFKPFLVIFAVKFQSTKYKKKELLSRSMNESRVVVSIKVEIVCIGINLFSSSPDYLEAYYMYYNTKSMLNDPLHEKMI